ncbi:MAG: excinuclease ABC subunit UvrA [Rickettsiales bacterium]|nr:excinuclease ABC subunit UvrA [Rickettsiales bacterium]
MYSDFIEIIKASENNLKEISLRIPKNRLVVITGISGSGKSSLAFDTLYAEGQRRYVESLSAYARQFLHLNKKPNVEKITGLTPAIAIDQKSLSKNPRSTVGTVTEIYDYLRLLYARIGIPYSPHTGKPIESQSASQIVEKIKALKEGSKIIIMAPIIRGQKGEHQKELFALKKHGFQRIRIDGHIYTFDELPKMDKNKKHTIELIVDRLIISESTGNRLSESIETALKYGNGIIMLEVDKQDANQKPIPLIFSEKFCCPVSNFQLEEIEPRIFSFNSPFGACQKCHGLGIEKYFDKKLIIPNPKLSINEGAIVPWERFKSRFQLNILHALSTHYKFNLDWPFEDLSQEVHEILLHGTKGEEIEITYHDGIVTKTTHKDFKGIIYDLENKMENAMDNRIQEAIAKFQSSRPCKACHGYRLKQESLCVKILDKNIGEVSNLTIKQALDWFETLPNNLSEKHNKIGEKVIQEITNRLKFLLNVGLEYLTLSRKTDSISGGEGQRIRLASQIGSGLSGVLYALDEPSIGLHQRDNMRLIATLRNLVNLGNTVIVVEHDEETILSADHVVDIGPGAGIHGGEITAQGSVKEILSSKGSLTGQYLSGHKTIAIPKIWRKGNYKKKIKLNKATTNNLKDVSIEVPLETFVAVTGVSGSGKSSLILDTLYKAIEKKLNKQSSVTPGKHDSISGIEYIDKIININQSPIGRTPRSNPATYIGAFSPIREWFANLPESKLRGYNISRFSFNVKGGRCETCQGDGVIKIEMHFLPDVYVNCEECKGKRYNKETLEIKYKDKSIADVLNMTAEDALKFFEKIPAIKDKLNALVEVGLGYMKIGQSAPSLSGGEAQRVKLAKELSKKSTGKTLYILDEPTTGLHIDDIKKLLKVLHRLVDLKNTVMVIEHNLHVIKTADYIIDIGPEGGDRGGEVVAFGPPQVIAKNKKSITGKYLSPYLQSEVVLYS